MIIKYNKAVRDKIPEIIRVTGATCKIKQLDDNEFLTALERKLVEEVKEYNESKSVEELIDLIEIIDRILELKKINQDEFYTMRVFKAKKRGKFRSNIFLLEVNEN